MTRGWKARVGVLQRVNAEHALHVMAGKHAAFCTSFMLWPGSLLHSSRMQTQPPARVLSTDWSRFLWLDAKFLHLITSSQYSPLARGQTYDNAVRPQAPFKLEISQHSFMLAMTWTLVCSPYGMSLGVVEENRLVGDNLTESPRLQELCMNSCIPSNAVSKNPTSCHENQLTTSFLSSFLRDIGYGKRTANLVA